LVAEQKKAEEVEGRADTAADTINSEAQEEASIIG